jgi:hypothetical protein
MPIVAATDYEQLLTTLILAGVAYIVFTGAAEGSWLNGQYFV